MPSEFNERIIAEFRANHGRVGGPFDGAPMALLTTTGAKSGRAHTTPLVYLPNGHRIVVIASKGGAPTNPDWYHNVVADPNVVVEVGDEKYAARAIVTSGEERDRLFQAQAAVMPQFGEYQKNTKRIIPVIALERVA